jgi:hypothetical protein
VQLNYTLTVDDYRQGFKALRKRRLMTRITYLFGYAIVAFAAIMLVLVLIFFDSKSFQNVLPLIFAAVVWAAILWLSPWLSARRIVSGPVYTSPHTVNIVDTGLHSRTPVSDGTITWPSIVSWQEVDRIFAIFLSPVAFIPIPKRVMTDPQQEEFRALLQQHVKPRTK